MAQVAGAPRAVGSPWAERLLKLHRQVRSAVAQADRAETGSRNPKGDDVKRFHLVANDAALGVLRDLQLPLVVDSEESGPLEIGSGTQRTRVVIDPVDGSDNWARGLPLSALSCAVLPIEAPLHPDWVEAALVGPLERETPLIALKGSGAWRGSERLEASRVGTISAAMISVELNHHSPSLGLARLMSAAQGRSVLRLRVPSAVAGRRGRHGRPCGRAWPADGGKLPRRRTAGDRGGGPGRRPRRRGVASAGKLDRTRRPDRGVEPGAGRRNRGRLEP